MSSEKRVVVPYADAKEGKKAQIESMFDQVAPTYDLLNRVLSMGIDNIWRRKAINELQKSKPQIILDVATGTADLALMAMRLQPQKIVGIDLSEEMLAIGRKKVADRGLSDIISLEKGDAENLPYESNSFDAITVAFGVRNFENLSAGLQELYRVLKPDGKLVVLEFSQPKVFPVKQLYYLYSKYILPNIGKLVSKDAKAYDYLPASIQAFPEGQAFVNHLQTAGFKSTKCISLLFGISSIYTGEK